MDAPKRIWAWVDDLAGIVGQSDEPETPPNLPAGPNAISPCAEYILATEHARIVAEKDARIAELEEALEAARRDALEEAAKVAEHIMSDYAELTYSPHHDRMQNAAKTYCAGEIAAAIRALAEKG